MGEWGGEEKEVGGEMVERQEKINYPAMLEKVDMLTGGTDYRKYLYYQLKMSMTRAKAIDIVVSFLMESGVRMILEDLKQAIDRGGKGKAVDGKLFGNHAAKGIISSEKGVK